MAERKLSAILDLNSAEFKKGLKDVSQDLGKFGAGFSLVGTGMFAAAVASAHFQKETAAAAQTAGMTTEAFSKLNYAAGKSGVNSEELAKSLNKLKNPSADMIGVFSKLGISMTDAQGKGKDSAELFKDLSQKMSQLPTSANQAKVALAVLGEEGAKLVPLLAMGRDGLEKMAIEADQYGQVVTQKAADSSKKFLDDLNLLGTGLKGVSNVVSESTTAFINQSGILQAGHDVLKGIISTWRSFDDNTKNTIMTIVAASTAFGGLLLALSAIMAIAPAVGKAFTVMMGPVGLIVLGIAAAAYGFIYLNKISNATINSSEELNKKISEQNDEIDKLAGSYKNLAGKKKDHAKLTDQESEAVRDLEKIASQYNISLTDSVGNYKTLNAVMDEVRKAREIELASKRIEIMLAQSYTLAALNEVNTKVDMARALANFVPIASSVLILQKNLQDRYDSMTKSLQGNTDATAANNAARGAKTKGPAADVDKYTPPEILYKSELLSAMQDVAKARQVYAIENLNDQERAAEMTKFDNKQKQEAIDKTSKLTQESIAYSKVIEAYANFAGKSLKPIGDLMDAINSGIKYGAQVAQRDLDIATAQSAAAYEKNKQDLEDSEKAKADAIGKSYDDQIAIIQNGENEKNNIINAAINERQLAEDAEYQAQKARLEQSYQDYLEDLRVKYDLRQQEFQEKSADKEQEHMAEDVLDADYKATLQNAEQAHAQKLADLAKASADRTKAIQDEGNAKKAAAQAVNDAKVKSLQDQKDAALAAAELDKNNKLAVLDAARTAQEKAEEKQRLQIQYDAEMDEYNNTLAIKIAATEAQGIAAAASAFAATAGALPFGLGIPIGAAIAAIILGTTQVSVANLISQKPVKPAGLLMADGGVAVLGGPSHAAGGIGMGGGIEAEGGEAAFLDRDRTSKFINAADSLTNAPRSIIINIEPGAIQTMNFDEAVMDKFSDILGQRVQRISGLR